MLDVKMAPRADAVPEGTLVETAPAVRVDCSAKAVRPERVLDEIEVHDQARGHQPLQVLKEPKRLCSSAVPVRSQKLDEQPFLRGEAIPLPLHARQDCFHLLRLVEIGVREVHDHQRQQELRVRLQSSLELLQCPGVITRERFEAGAILAVGVERRRMRHDAEATEDIVEVDRDRARQLLLQQLERAGRL